MLVWKDIYLFDELGFTKSKSDPNLYFKVMDDEPIILSLHVDDLFLTGNEKQIVECKRKLAEQFEMKDLGLMHYFLGPGSMVEAINNLSHPGKVCCGNLKKI